MEETIEWSSFMLIASQLMTELMNGYRKLLMLGQAQYVTNGRKQVDTDWDIFRQSLVQKLLNHRNVILLAVDYFSIFDNEFTYTNRLLPSDRLTLLVTEPYP